MAKYIESITDNGNGTVTFKFIDKDVRGFVSRRQQMTFKKSHLNRKFKEANMVIQVPLAVP